MNGAHWHLVVNHVSLFTVLFGAILFGVSIKRNSTELRMTATALFVLTGVFAWLAVETGESAAHIVKGLGLDTRPFVHQHAQAADWAERTGILVALVAIALEWAIRNKQKLVKPLQWALLVFAVHSTTVHMRVAYLGGLVRHTEIRDSQGASATAPGSQSGKSHDDWPAQ